MKDIEGAPRTALHYADRDIIAMDKAGNYYIRHVSALTREGLHLKSDIAAELGWRDMEIDRLRALSQPQAPAESAPEKNARNARVQARYDELMQAGKHGHYETMFRVVREEVANAQAWALYKVNGFGNTRALAAPKPPEPADTRALRDVIAERQRQVSVEGWTTAHDDEHRAGDLPRAAACYAYPWGRDSYPAGNPPGWWPWDEEWWKPADNRRNLVRAGALILAEIERLDRAKTGEVE